jgi:hypothetical protein
MARQAQGQAVHRSAAHATRQLGRSAHAVCATHGGPGRRLVLRVRVCAARRSRPPCAHGARRRRPRRGGPCCAARIPSDPRAAAATVAGHGLPTHPGADGRGRGAAALRHDCRVRRRRCRRLPSHDVVRSVTIGFGDSKTPPDAAPRDDDARRYAPSRPRSPSRARSPSRRRSPSPVRRPRSPSRPRSPVRPPPVRAVYKARPILKPSSVSAPRPPATVPDRKRPRARSPSPPPPQAPEQKGTGYAVEPELAQEDLVDE